MDLTASGGNAKTYVWDQAEELNTIAGPKVTVRPSKTRSYFVRALDENFCEMEGHVTVEVAPSEFVEVSSSQSRICPNSRIALEAKGADSYEWLMGENIRYEDSARTSARPQQSSTYRVVGTNQSRLSRTPRKFK